MEIVYGTTNKSKVAFMQNLVESLGIRILSLDDVAAPKLNIEENGNSPLENARIKALAYYEALGRHVLSADSGLYIDGLDDGRQPGLNVRGLGNWMSDDGAIAYYAGLAAEMGGQMTARYRNAVCLIINGEIHEHFGEDIASAPFILTSKPHEKRNKGFPLDSLSIDIESGKYYFDLKYPYKYKAGDGGFAQFFERALRGKI
jgi:8-oxo-dGTP diphosphatase